MSITPYSYGNVPTYRFYISKVAGSTTYEVFPLKFLSSTLVDELEKDNVFYRRKFNGSLLFGTNSLVIDDSGVTQNRKDDWALLWGIEQNDPCARLFFTITKEVSGSTTTYWEGHFSTTDGNFDVNRCTFEVTPMTDDDYTDILSEADTQYNILDNPVTGLTTITTHAVYGSIYIAFTRNRWLFNVIEYLADQVIPGVTVSSDFFTAATNPATLSPNKLLYLTIAQKSDIIRPASSDPATASMISWSEMMKILWGMFQVKWNYDGVSTINVEHISWFTSGVGIDLRTQLSCKATEKYSYLKEKMPKYEKFAFMEADEINFIGQPISYYSPCVDQNPDSNIKETIVDNVTTDLEFIINNPDAIADEGFVILCNYESGGLYYVEIQSGSLITNAKLNMRLSWANLENSYFRHNRVLIEGYLNGVLTTFWTAQKNKQQSCSIILCDDFDPDEEITTELGETYFSGAKAKVKSAEISSTGLVKLNLLYGPPDTEVIPISDTKLIIINQDTTCWTLSAILTDPAPIGGLVIHLTETIRDAMGVIQCVGDEETWTIPEGELTDTYTVTPCLYDLFAGWCVEFAYSTTGVDWGFDFNYNMDNCGCI